MSAPAQVESKQSASDEAKLFQAPAARKKKGYPYHYGAYVDGVKLFPPQSPFHTGVWKEPLGYIHGWKKRRKIKYSAAPGHTYIYPFGC